MFQLLPFMCHLCETSGNNICPAKFKKFGKWWEGWKLKELLHSVFANSANKSESLNRFNLPFVLELQCRRRTQMDKLINYRTVPEHAVCLKGFLPKITFHVRVRQLLFQHPFWNELCSSIIQPWGRKGNSALNRLPHIPGLPLHNLSPANHLCNRIGLKFYESFSATNFISYHINVWKNQLRISEWNIS